MPRAAFPSARKLLLLLALATTWWWQRPPLDPVYQGKRLSDAFLEPRDFGSAPAMREYFRRFGPAGVSWLTYKLEHGRRPNQRNQPLPFDHAPGWLRRWVPEKWGGLHSHSSIDERMNAANLLTKLGPYAASAIPRLARVLKDPDEDVVGFAADALNSTGPASWQAVSEALEHGSVSTRSALLRTMFWRFQVDGEAAPDTEVALAIGALVKGCHDPDAKVRSAVLRCIAFCKYQPKTPLFLPLHRELIRLLSDVDSTVRIEAVNAAGFLGADAAPAIARLIELLDDPLPELRASSAIALGEVDRSEKQSAARLRIMLLNDPDSDCRKFANDALTAFARSPDKDGASPEALPAQ